MQVFATDLVNGIPEGVAYELGNRIEFIVHMAAETHVDNSIKDPVPFIRNNVESTSFNSRIYEKFTQKWLRFEEIFLFQHG